MEFSYNIDVAYQFTNPCKDGERYFCHADHTSAALSTGLGSSAFITSEMRSIREDLWKTIWTEQNYATQFLAYMPFGETLSEQQNSTSYYSPFKFSAKEKDPETGYSYFGARYYSPELSVWLGIDPLSDEFPNWTPYHYVHNNPVNMVDPDGRKADWVEDAEGNIYWDENSTSQATTKPGEKYLGKAVVVFEGCKDEKLGKDGKLDGKGANPANVTIYGPGGEDDVKTYLGLTVSSDPEKFPMVEEGDYEGRHQQMATSLYGKGSLTYRVHNQDGSTRITPEGGSNKATGKKYMEGVFMHRTDWNGKADRSSQGCLLIDGRRWKDVEKQLGTLDSFLIRVIR